MSAQPGATLIILVVFPFHSPVKKPSSFAICLRDWNVLCFLLELLPTCCLRVFTTSNGVVNMVANRPDTRPAKPDCITTLLLRMFDSDSCCLHVSRPTKYILENGTSLSIIGPNPRYIESGPFFFSMCLNSSRILPLLLPELTCLVRISSRGAGMRYRMRYEV